MHSMTSVESNTELLQHNRFYVLLEQIKYEMDKT